MKYKILFTFFLLFHYHNFFGQDSKINYQFNVGPNLSIPYKSTILIFPDYGSSSPVIKYNSDIGFFAEFLLGYNIKNSISINSGLNYAFVNYKINKSIVITTDVGTSSNSYLTLPAFINIKLMDKYPLYFGIGAYISILLSSIEKGTESTNWSLLKPVSSADSIILPKGIQISKYNLNVKYTYNSIDLGLLTQISYNARLSNKIQLVLFSRLTAGSLNVVKPNYTYSWRNYIVNFGTGIKL